MKFNRVKAEQRGSDILYTCYGKVLYKNDFMTMSYFTVIQSIKDELWEKIKCAIKTR